MNSIDRRGFIKGGAAASVIAAAGMLSLTGCSSETNTSSDEQSFNVSETIDADIVIVGAGVSGIAAAVQAGENGDTVVLLDWNTTIGGAGVGVEGIFGWNSPMQQEQGIAFDQNTLVAHEVAGSNYLVDPAPWKKLAEASGDNIAWLLENGVEFNNLIDTYPIAYPDGTVAEATVNCFHWFGGESAYEGFEGGNAYQAYVLKMEEKIQEYGVDVRTSTRGTNLIFDEDRNITGLYALLSDETYLQVNAKAIILATGGILNDSERLKARGINPDRVVSQIIPGSSGDGAKMAIDEAGAKEYFRTAYEGWNGIPGTPTSWTTIGINMGFGGPVLWVNEYAERFTNENLGIDNFDLAFVPRQNYKEQYVFTTKKHAYEVLLENDEELIADWERRVEEDSANVWESDTVEELAEMAGLDAATLKATVDRYNELCVSGEDVDFLKESEKMIELSESPFLLYATTYALDSSFGCICVDEYCRAVDINGDSIPGLYAVGVDGCMLYSNVYRIDIPGSGCANSVNSGRVAANHAHEVIL